MIDVNIRLTRDALAARATSIGKPASALMISAFEKNYGIVVHSALRSFYMACNGLVSAGSLLISIYDLDSVKVFYTPSVSLGYFIFGDIMLQSDDIAADFLSPTNPVIMLGSMQTLAANFNALLANLVA